MVQTGERQGQVRTALVAGHRVDLVDDDRAHGAQRRARPLGGQKDEERLRRRDQNVGRLAQHLGALGLGRVARADGGADRAQRDPALVGQRADLRERSLEVALHVVGQCLEWRHVDDQSLVAERARLCPAHDLVDRGQERGEGLSRSGRRRDEDVAAGAHRGPAKDLRLRRLPEAVREPIGDEGVEVFGHQGRRGRVGRTYVRTSPSGSYRLNVPTSDPVASTCELIAPSRSRGRTLGLTCTNDSSSA